MEFLGLGLAVVGFVLAALVWRGARQKSEEAARQISDLEKRLAREVDQRKTAEASRHAADERSKSLEHDLAEALARRDERAMAIALWELELERSYRQWRDVIVPTDASRSLREVNAGQQLAFAVSQEVERLREEVGVSIRFDGGLDLPMEPEVALGALRICEELLALAAKRSDEVGVSLDQGDEPSLVIALRCAGWDDGGRAGDGVLERDLERMAARLDGWLRWTSEGENVVRATLRLPAPPPEPSPISSNALRMH